MFLNLPFGEQKLEDVVSYRVTSKFQLISVCYDIAPVMFCLGDRYIRLACSISDIFLQKNQFHEAPASCESKMNQVWRLDIQLLVGISCLKNLNRFLIHDVSLPVGNKSFCLIWQTLFLSSSAACDGIR